MLKLSRKRKRREMRGRITVAFFFGLAVIFGAVLFVGAVKTGHLTEKLRYEVCFLMLRQYAPLLAESGGMPEYEDTDAAYETQTESELLYEQVLAREAADESLQSAQAPVQQTEQASDQQTEQAAETGAGQGETASAGQPVSLEKLNDFDYLIQHYYTVDKMTTTNGKQLNAKKLLAKDCTVKKNADGKPEILIYHTHSQEGYRGTKSGDPSTTVVGVGDRLTEILEETYGYHVLHHKGVYDAGDRNNAYSRAAPDLEKILKENPSIQVVIDLHRDGVDNDTRLVTEVDGKKTAQIMFFNGLSRTTSTGAIDYLKNPNISDNLAFSLQMQLAAAGLYPGFTRKIYLKGYRYNMHYCPKSLLIEVGAQNNTLKEAMNAMEPLAKVLDQVIGGNKQE